MRIGLEDFQEGVETVHRCGRLVIVLKSLKRAMYRLVLFYDNSTVGL